MMRVSALVYDGRGRYAILGCAVVVAYGFAFTFALSSAHSRGVSAEQFAIGTGDSAYYVSIAQTSLDAHVYAKTPDAPPEYARLPGYPLFIALLLALFRTPLAVPIIQIVLVAISALCIARIGERFFSPIVGFLAAALFALDPNVITLSLSALSDTLFVSVLLLASLILLRIEDVGLKRIVIGGLLLGALSLIRPVGIFIVPVFALWILYVHRARIARALSLATVLCAAVIIVIAPWMERNHSLSGHFALSTAGTYNVLFYNVVEFEAFRTGRNANEVRAEFIAQVPATAEAPLDSFAHTDQEAAMIRAHLAPHFLQYVFFHVVKTVPFFIGSSLAAAQDQLALSGALPNVPARTANLSSLVLSGDLAGALDAFLEYPFMALEQSAWFVITLLMFTVIGIAIIRRPRNLPVILFCAAIIAELALLTGPVSMPRYRVPVEPHIFLLVSAGVIAVIRFSVLRHMERTTP